MDIRRLVSSSALAIAFVASIVACSGADSTGPTVGGSPAKDTNPTTPSKNNTSSSSSSGSTSSTSSSSGAPSNGDAGPAPSGNDATCGTKTTAKDCGECCYQNHQAGADAADQAWGDCICGAGGACATQCATSLCSQNGAEPKQGDACDTCLEGQAAKACDQTADTACKANADCVAFDACIAAAKCDEKQ
jgi:hypothetical protein